MNRVQKLDGSLQAAPKEPDLVDTVRELPEYFPSSWSPEQWVAWLCESNRSQWQDYLRGWNVFERERREWQTEKAQMERERDELSRRNVLQAWISVREEAWKAERAIWKAEKNALLLERERVAQVVTSTTSYVSRNTEKVKKESQKSQKFMDSSTQSTVSASDGQPVVGSGAIGTVDQVPVERVSYQSSVDASAPALLYPDSDVTDRLHKMLLRRAELITLKRQLNDLPEWTPEMIRQTPERLIREHDQQLLRRYDADDIISIDNDDPGRVSGILEEKLEVTLSTSANSIRMGFQFSIYVDGGSERKANALQLFERYGLSRYVETKNSRHHRQVIVNVPEQAFEEWILLYRKRAS